MNKTKNNKVPKLRFPEFNSEWKETIIGDIYSFLPTYSYSRSQLNYESGDFKNIHYGDIHTKYQTNFITKDASIPYITNSEKPSSVIEENFCKIGDLIIADASEDYNDIGKTIEIRELSDEKILAGLHTFLARDEKGLTEIGFMGYYQQNWNVRLQKMKYATGISVLGISKTNLKKVKVYLPSNSEQQKIASFLTSVDDKIQQLTKKKELLEKYKKGVMQKIFSQQIRFKPALSEAEVDENGKDYPDWEKKKLKSIGDFFSGGTPKSTKREFFSGDIPFIKSGEIGNDYTQQFITEDAIKNSSAKRINNGDLLYALYGATSGEVAISKIDGAINQAILCIRCNINNVFLYNYLKIKKNKIVSTFLQGGQGNLSAEIVKDFVVPYPNISEQNIIADFLSSIDKKIDSVNKQLEKTKEFKKGLLQQMFV